MPDGAPIFVNRSPAIVGTWAVGDTTYTFNADNTFKFEGQQGGVNVTSSGTYTESDPKVTLTPKTFDLTSSDPKISAMLGPVKEKAKSQMNKDQVSTITWSGKDTFSLAGPQGGSQSFTRKK